MQKLERESEEERAEDRKYEIIDQEHESYDGYNKKRKLCRLCANYVAAEDVHQSSHPQSRKLGFGLEASGKRTAVPSVFHEEDEDAQKKKKLQPLVPIDYSNEELQAVQHRPSGALSPDLAAAAEFAKRITSVKFKEERPEDEKDTSRRSHDSSQRDQEWNDHGSHRTRDDNRKETVDHDKDRERRLDKVKTPDKRNLLDAKHLIHTIPKTKNELFSYEINWAIYDKNQLHERMRPWISKKIEHCVYHSGTRKCI